MKIKIYTLASSANPGEIRYVGKTKQELKRRLQGHLCDAHKHLKNEDTKNHNYNWINKEESLGNKIIIEELDCIEIENNEDWKWLEVYWIAQIKIWGYKITNLTSGGDGNQNQHFSKESIELRASKIRGIPRSEETRQKISESHMGKILTNEHKNNVREAIIKLQGKPVLQFDKQGNFIKEWRCGAEAARFYNVDKSSLMRCCQGKFKSSAGFVWKYK